MKARPMKLMNPTKAVYQSINMHPSLYASQGIDIAKLRIYDHIFNVIGNGIRDTEEFIEYMQDDGKDVQKPAAKYLSGERLYFGYTEVEEFGSAERKISFGKSGSMLHEVFTETEKTDHPEVKKWVGFNPVDKFNPYPNFKKEYSTVWQIDTSILTPEWIEEIIWFYRKCEEFFDGPDSHEYHCAIPIEPKALNNRINDYEKWFPKYKKETSTQEEYWAAITEAYKTEYRGDTLDFIKRRWKAEHARIREFIAETISMLEGLKK